MTIREAPRESRGRVLRLGPNGLKLDKETTLMEVRWTRVQRDAAIAHADGLARDARLLDHLGREVRVLDVRLDLLDDLRGASR